MKKNKKVIIILISLISLLLIGIVIYIVFIKNNANYLYDKQLRYYEWENEKYNEYRYTCKNSSCKSKKIEDNLYLLDDNGKYLYKPVENEKTKVDFNSDGVYSIIKDNDDKIKALILRDGDYDNGTYYIYIMSEKKTYLQNKGYTDVDFLKHINYENDDEYYINFDLVVARGKNNNILVIDYKKDNILFDSSKLDFNNKDDIYLSFSTIKINDNKYFYDISSETGYAYILDDKFNKISSYSSKGRMGQFGAGNQYSIDNNKIYIVNVDDKDYSVYDLTGKLIKKSEKLDYVYCTDKGYFLISKEIDDVSYDVVVDFNGKEIFKIEHIFGEARYIDYDKNENTIYISITTGVESGYTYTYNLKTGNLTKSEYDY